MSLKDFRSATLNLEDSMPSVPMGISPLAVHSVLVVRGMVADGGTSNNVFLAANKCHRASITMPHETSFKICYQLVREPMEMPTLPRDTHAEVD